VQSAPVPVTHEMQTSAVVATSPGVTPTRSSLGVAAEGGALRTPPSALESRAVVAKVAPPPAPIPFAAKQQALAANGGRPLAPAQETQIRQSTPELTRTNTTLYRPAAVAPAGGGLKTAHEGLAAATPATGVAAQGFVPRAAVATRTPGASPAVRGTTPPAPPEAPANAVARPPNRVPTATRVPPASGNPGPPASAGAATGTAANGSAARVGGANGSAEGGKPAGTAPGGTPGTTPGSTPGSTPGTTGSATSPHGATVQGNGTPKNGTLTSKPHTAKKPPPPRPRPEEKQPDKPDKGKGR
jgi:hypothetical protein